MWVRVGLELRLGLVRVRIRVRVRVRVRVSVTEVRKWTMPDTMCYNWPMSVHASQAFSIAHCSD